MYASARSLALALVAVAVAPSAAQVRPTVTAPAKGALVLAGGGSMGVDVFRRFLALAGGFNAPIVVIPTGLGAPRYTQGEVDVVWFRQAGATHVTLLDTLNPTIADSDRFVAALTTASGVWFGGGRQWILANVYLHTKTAEAIRAVLDRGGVVGGVSAGATFSGRTSFEATNTTTP
jgi:cyanophycinase